VAANGSRIEREAKVVGSVLIGQAFTGETYFHGRPSATSKPARNDASKTVEAPYNAANSASSNLGPTSKALIDRVTNEINTLKSEKSHSAVPKAGSIPTFRGKSPSSRCRVWPKPVICRRTACVSSSKGGPLVCSGNPG